MTIDQRRNSDGTISIDEHDLLWLLRCSKDMLEFDLQALHGHPNEASLITSNIKRIQEAIDSIEDDTI
jgi:hypothetical protein